MQAEILDALRRGANDEALALARAAVDADAQDPQAHRLLAMALRAGGDDGAALASIERAIALAPDDADLHFHRAGYLVGRRDLEAAQAALSQSVQLDPNQYGAYVMQAQLALSRGDLDEADRNARLAARVDPDHPWTQLLDGSVALQRGDKAHALAVLSQAAHQAPDDAQIRYALGFAYLENGHLAFAEKSFEGLLDKLPGTSRLRALVAELQRRQGRPGDAADTLAPLLELADTTPALQRFAGELELEAGRVDRALPPLRAALAAQPEDPRTVVAIFEAWRRKNDREDARGTLDAALATTTQSIPLWQARVAVERGAVADALAVVERWLAAMPDAVPALEMQLQLLEDSGDLDACEAVARRITAQLPGHPGAEMHIVQGLMRRDPPAAVKHVADLLAKAGNDDARRSLRSWLGHAYDRAGRHADAVAMWSSLQADALANALPLPDPATPVQQWPAMAERRDDAAATAFLAGAPGSGVERLARLLAGAVPAFRDDRFGPQAPEDHLQNYYLPHRLVKGEVAPDEVAADWQAQLPARGIADGRIVDWLLWWDNALLMMLRAHLPHARLLIALRDPRDMLLDWLAFGAPIQFKFASPQAAAGWLAIHLNQLAVLDEQALFPHTLIRMDELINDEAAAARALGDALGTTLPAPPKGLFGGPRFADGRWRDYAAVLAEPFALLTPVARRLGYPEA